MIYTKGSTLVASDEVYATVVGMDVAIQGVVEDDEVTVGSIIGVNRDDDNGNGTVDRSDTGTVARENDLRQVDLSGFMSG